MEAAWFLDLFVNQEALYVKESTLNTLNTHYPLSQWPRQSMRNMVSPRKGAAEMRAKLQQAS